MKCPGQDRAYWKADAVFEVPCPQCGVSVELFKDEATGHCPRCGHRFPNPGVEIGCAEWCSLAQECLGVAPQLQSFVRPEGALAARLIHALDERFQSDRPRFACALKVFQFAKSLVGKHGGDPRVILAAALLLELVVRGSRGASGPNSSEDDAAGGMAEARGLLKQSGLDEETSRQIDDILTDYRAGRKSDTLEFRVVCEAAQMADLQADKG
jgi:hypothetical protein